MTRYLNSFLITLVLYAGVVFAFIIVFADDKVLIKKEIPLQQTISLKHIELIPVPKLEKRIEKIIEKKVEKPKEIKKVVKKEEPKKVVKKKVVKKKVVKKPIKKKEIKVEKVKEEKQIVKEIAKEIVKEKPTNIQKPKKIAKRDIKKDYLEKHLRLIRKQIKQNVHYPKSAKRLKIQGIVNVKFTLRSNGVVDNIVILNGHSRLKKSTINAVKDAAASFPKIKKDITIQLPIEYKLI